MRHWRGKWAGRHTAQDIAELMGVSTITAKRLLYRKQEALQRDLTPEDIGDLIYEYKQTLINRSVASYLKPSWL